MALEKSGAIPFVKRRFKSDEEKTVTPRLRQRIRPGARSDAGFTLVEMMVALVILSMVTSGFAYSLQLTLITTQGNTARVQAANLAARELEIVRNEFGATKSAPLTVGATSQAINPHPLPGQGSGPLRIDGRPFTVVRTVEWLPVGSGVSPCDGGSAVTYPSLGVHVRVSWDEKGTTRDVESNTVLTPPKGTLATIKGFIAAKVQGASGTGVADVPVDISGAASQTRVTADDGCAVFAIEAIGSYTVTLDDPGYISFDGQTTTSKVATVGNGTIQIVPFSYDRAAGINLQFEVIEDPDTEYTMPTPKPAVTLFNPSLATMGRKIVPSGTTSVTNLWPYPDGYSVWAGSCMANDPANSGGTRPQPVTPDPGDTVTATVPLMPVHATFLDDDGQPLKLKDVTAQLVDPAGCTEPLLTYGQTDDEGVAKVALPYGKWSLNAGGISVEAVITSDADYPLMLPEGS